MPTITFTAPPETSQEEMKALRQVAKDLPLHDPDYAQWTIRVVRGDGPCLSGRMDQHPAALSLYATLLGTIDRVKSRAAALDELARMAQEDGFYS